MNVEIVAVGSELLLGQIVDTNSTWIAQQMAAAGLDSCYQTKVGDNPERMKEVFELALSRSDAVICCGGLGPTQDDITREVLADVMGVELQRDEAMVEKIGEMFRSRGREMPENNLLQALVPVGASVIPEQPGTAPGLMCPVGESQMVYAVPGVPYEMKEMVTGSIIPDLSRRMVERSGRSSVIKSRVLRTWGTSESALAERLSGRIEELDGSGPVTLAFLASGVEGLKVRITTKASDEAAARSILDSEEQRVRSLLGDVVFGVDDQNMESVVVELLRDRGLSVSVAESVTGGYVAGRLCAVPGASDVFLGGVVAYHAQVKHSVLGVREGPVISESCAVAMAQGVREVTGSAVGLATTGVAGPEELEGKPAGFVCLAIASDDGAVATTLQLPGDRERVRQYSTISLLNFLRQILET